MPAEVLPCSRITSYNVCYTKLLRSIYDILEEKRIAGQTFASWSRRQREYNEKIKSGDLCEVAEVSYNFV